MPEPLWDLSTLDLDKIDHRREDVEKLLPHRGFLSLLDGVIHFDSQEKVAVGFMDIQETMFWVPGHFPGNPVLPGVVLVEASAQLSLFGYKKLFPAEADRLMVFGGVDHARFRGIVRPGDRVYIVSKAISANTRFLRSATQAIVRERIVYEGEILGVNT